MKTTPITLVHENQEYQILYERLLSDYPDDGYLKAVMGKCLNPVFPEKPYCTMLYHVQRNGFFNGRYNMTQEEAFQDFEKREYKEKTYGNFSSNPLFYQTSKDGALSGLVAGETS